jgi:hypothetical protein
MFDPKEELDRLTKDMDPEEVAELERIVREEAKGKTGANIRSLFGGRDEMRHAIQAMTLSKESVLGIIDHLGEMEDEASTESVGLGIMMNLVILLRLMGADSSQVLDLASRATLLADDFEEAMGKTKKYRPFGGG